jgi:hypothetical protein
MFKVMRLRQIPDMLHVLLAEKSVLCTSGKTACVVQLQNVFRYHLPNNDGSEARFLLYNWDGLNVSKLGSGVYF